MVTYDVTPCKNCNRHPVDLRLFIDATGKTHWLHYCMACGKFQENVTLTVEEK